MNRNNEKTIIFIYNLYTLFFYPLAIFLTGYWSWESQSPNSYGRIGVLPIAVLLIFGPEIIFGLKWDLNYALGGRIFTILCSMTTGWILHKLFYWYYMSKTYAPITYYTQNLMLVSGIIWTAIIEFNQTLRKHILLFPQNKWLVPNSLDEAEDRFWNRSWMVVFGTSLAFMLLVTFRII